MTEIWKTIPGFEGRYEVSDEGRVRSTGFYVRIRSEKLRWAAPKVLKAQVKRPSGHLFVSPDHKRVYIHRAVLTAFIGPCPDGLEGCHDDGDTTNNWLSNLRWDTRQSNVDDSIFHGTWAHGEMIPNSILTEQTVIWARSQKAQGCKTKDLALFYGVADPTMFDALSGRTWAHL